MATESPKTAPQPEQGFPPNPYQHYHGGYPPPFFAYPPPADAAQGENSNSPPAQPGPYMMFGPPPPGMVYAFPPPGYPSPSNSNSSPSRPKRKQVKMACTNCATACKRCDETRPCERCVKYGIADACIDGQRKERKKGVKRGPYKRKAKASEGGYGEFAQNADGAAEWSPAGAGPPGAGLQTVPHFATPEGLYPVYYPPPGAYPPVPAMDPGANGVEQNGAPPNGHGHPPPPFMPYYLPGYPLPFYPGMPLPPGVVLQQPPTGDNVAKDAGGSGGATASNTPAPADPAVEESPPKKKVKTGKDGKGKKKVSSEAPPKTVEEASPDTNEQEQGQSDEHSV